MTKRILVSLSAVGTLFLLACFAQVIEPTQQLTVYDAGGKRVGVVTGGERIPSIPLVPFKVDGVPFLLLAFRDGFRGAKCCGSPPTARVWRTSASTLA